MDWKWRFLEIKIVWGLNKLVLISGTPIKFMFEFGLNYSGRVIKINQQSDDHSQVGATSIMTLTTASTLDDTL
jgi:hypothetical protein